METSDLDLAQDVCISRRRKPLARQRGLEYLHAVVQRLGEPLFLLPEHLRHAGLRRGQLRVGRAHRAVEVLHDAVEERLVLPELVAVADCAAGGSAPR